MIRLLSISGSPVEGSSTELLLRKIAHSVAENSGDKVRHRLVRLNDLDITACQACGEDPAPDFCFVGDGMAALYNDVVNCDCLLFGSPIYFDAVSAQAKAFIDRCNCLRPADFDDKVAGHHFIKRIGRKRPGAMVLVGGEQAWFEGARRCIAGLFKWIEVTNEGHLMFCSKDFNRIGEVADDVAALRQADKLGRKLARIVSRSHV